jgi:hypothetical protein
VDLMILAQDFTHDLHEAHYLVHSTMMRALDRQEEWPLSHEDCSRLMRQQAREAGLAA